MKMSSLFRGFYVHNVVKISWHVAIGDDWRKLICSKNLFFTSVYNKFNFKYLLFIFSRNV